MATCESNIINVKVGSAVVLDCVYKASDGTPLDLTGITIAADFIHPKTGVVLSRTTTIDGSITLGTNTGEYKINAGITTGWPLGEMPVDILYTKNGIPQHTEDFILDFTQGRTGSIPLLNTG